MLFLAQMIHASLDRWKLVLAKGPHGKDRYLQELVDFINQSDHELVRGKTTTKPTVNIWISAGKELAQADYHDRCKEDIRMRSKIEYLLKSKSTVE